MKSSKGLNQDYLQDAVTEDFQVQLSVQGPVHKQNDSVDTKFIQI